MTPEATTSLNATDKAQAAFRRLLLAKQLYLHGLDHSNRAGPLNNMIAVHGFHNAIEIALKAIISHHDIRIDKLPYRVNFEDMLRAIDDHPAFKGEDTKLPYRGKITNLNQYRNLVQHDAAEPPANMMDEWRVFTRLFLEEVYRAYFDLEFDNLSPLEMIDDEVLKDLLRLSLSFIGEGDFKNSLLLAKSTFQMVTVSMFRVFPDEVFFSSSFTSAFISRFPESDLKNALQMLDKKSEQAEYHAVILSSGVSLADYKRLASSPPSFFFSLTSDKPFMDWGQTEPDEETARWVHEFVVTTIVRWQVLGLAPSISGQAREAIQKLIGETESALTFKSFLETYDSHHPKEPPQLQADVGESPPE